MNNQELYTCPMHPEVISKEQGKCPKCGMNLVLQSEVKSHVLENKSFFETYKPLFTIFGLILLATIIFSIRGFYNSNYTWQNSFSIFMGGFFLVFSGFKLLDLEGFKEGYSTYDLLARKVPSYGYFYPFIELFLGFSYLLNFQLQIINIVTVVLMFFSGLGVLDSIANKRKFQCACLGTIIKIPLTQVTLIEDFGMSIMALVMLVIPPNTL